ncbi:MAG: TldD/PmbA family protein [Clostridia bacterium]|nr:TldD/PmbA family protein [Clostridia bacterium]
MIEKLKNHLKSCGCDGWEIQETSSICWEFYFIRHKLDQHRVVRERNYDVKLYKSTDEGKYLGSASCRISPTANDKEIAKQIGDLVFQAGLVKNPAYSLASKKVSVPDKLNNVDVESICKDYISGIQSVNETEGELINSFEIFAKEIERYTLNSNGVEYRCRYPSSTVELVINARNGSEEIELYRLLRSGTCDRKRLISDIEKLMGYGRDRLKAVPTPRIKTGDVVFSTSDATEIYSYFLDKMSAGSVYRKISDWKIGEPVCAGEGDKITLKAVSRLENSSMDFEVDEEGSEITDRFIIRNGVAENYWGSRQFSQYVGLDSSSIVHNAVFEGGKKDKGRIRTGDYLEVVEFSSFQVDYFSGEIAGEIRLGYLHKDGAVSIVTGGSVSGSMAEAAETMEFSRETVQYDTLVIPEVTKLKGLRINGAE